MPGPAAHPLFLHPQPAAADAAAPPRRDPIASLRRGCERPWEAWFTPFTVAPGVHYVGNDWVGAYLLESSDGLILIDTTMQAQVYLLFESIRRLGFDPRDIRLILLSHMHYDHVGGARALAEYSGAKIMMSREDTDFLRDRPDQLLAFGYPCGSFEVDAFLRDDAPVTLGDVTIRPRLTPGHTPGTMSFFFEAREEDGRRLRCGLHGGIGLNALTEAFMAEHDLPRSWRDDYLAGMAKVRDEPVDVTLGSHPVHVDMLAKVPRIAPGVNPFHDPAIWPAFIDALIGKMRLLEAELG